MKHFFAKRPQPDPMLLTLQAELKEAQSDLTLAYGQFNQAVEPELVEACVYQISAVKARCSYLIRAIKERSQHGQTAAERRSILPASEAAAPVMGTQEAGQGGAVWS